MLYKGFEVFVAEEAGPIEPSIYRAWSGGRPDIKANMLLPEGVHDLADSVRRRPRLYR